MFVHVRCFHCFVLMWISFFCTESCNYDKKYHLLKHSKSECILASSEKHSMKLTSSNISNPNENSGSRLGTQNWIRLGCKAAKLVPLLHGLLTHGLLSKQHRTPHIVNTLNLLKSESHLASHTCTTLSSYPLVFGTLSPHIVRNVNFVVPELNELLDQKGYATMYT